MVGPDLLRIGFIGAGGIARSRHLPNLATIPSAKVVVVANRSRESSQKVAGEFGIPEVAHDWRRVLDRSDVDAVFIGTWPYMHREMSVAALQAGKHVFCQARMAMDLSEAKAMAEAAKAQPKLVNMICPPPHRMPFEPWVRHTIQSGQLGPITAVELVSASAANLDRQRVTWREEVQYSGKQILAMGIWAETLNAWVGPYAELSACLATPIPTKRDPRNPNGGEVRIDIPQVVSITGRLASGAVAAEQHTGLAADAGSRGDCLTIWGLAGTIRYRLGDTIELAKAGQELKPVDVPAELRRPWRVEQDFVEAVQQARAGQSWKVSPDFEEGLLYMRKVEAVHLAAAAGQAVKPETL